MSARTVPSMSTLERTYDRMPRFLRAIAFYPVIAGALARRGLTREIVQDGWNRFFRATGIDRLPPVVGGSGPAADATHELDAWDEDGFRLVGAAFKHEFPPQYEYVMNGLTATTGTDAVIGVRRLLGRLDDLEHAPERANTREQDHAALAKLAQRGIDAAERARLWALVHTAQDAAPAPSEDIAARSQERLDALIELHAWFEEWAEVARVVIKKRGHLIALGLVNRAQPTRTEQPGTGEIDPPE